MAHATSRPGFSHLRSFDRASETAVPLVKPRASSEQDMDAAPRAAGRRVRLARTLFAVIFLAVLALLAFEIYVALTGGVR